MAQGVANNLIHGRKYIREGVWRNRTRLNKLRQHFLGDLQSLFLHFIQRVLRRTMVCCAALRRLSSAKNPSVGNGLGQQRSKPDGQKERKRLAPFLLWIVFVHPQPMRAKALFRPFRKNCGKLFAQYVRCRGGCRALQVFLGAAFHFIQPCLKVPEAFFQTFHSIESRLKVPEALFHTFHSIESRVKAPEVFFHIFHLCKKSRRSGAGRAWLCGWGLLGGVCQQVVPLTGKLRSFRRGCGFLRSAERVRGRTGNGGSGGGRRFSRLRGCVFRQSGRRFIGARRQWCRRNAFEEGIQIFRGDCCLWNFRRSGVCLGSLRRYRSGDGLGIVEQGLKIF